MVRIRVLVGYDADHVSHVVPEASAALAAASAALTSTL